MSTIKQQKAIENLVENRGNIGKAMKEAGYSKNTAKNPKNLTESKGFKELLSEIEDKPLLDRLREIALSKQDKRANISAIKEILTLKNAYPDKKVSLNVFKDREKFFK